MRKNAEKRRNIKENYKKPIAKTAKIIYYITDKA